MLFHDAFSGDVVINSSFSFNPIIIEGLSMDYSTKPWSSSLIDRWITFGLENAFSSYRRDQHLFHFQMFALFEQIVLTDKKGRGALISVVDSILLDLLKVVKEKNATVLTDLIGYLNNKCPGIDILFDQDDYVLSPKGIQILLEKRKKRLPQMDTPVVTTLRHLPDELIRFAVSSSAVASFCICRDLRNTTHAYQIYVKRKINRFDAFILNTGNTEYQNVSGIYFYVTKALKNVSMYFFDCDRQNDLHSCTTFAINDIFDMQKLSDCKLQKIIDHSKKITKECENFREIGLLIDKLNRFPTTHINHKLANNYKQLYEIYTTDLHDMEVSFRKTYHIKYRSLPDLSSEENPGSLFTTNQLPQELQRMTQSISELAQRSFWPLLLSEIGGYIKTRQAYYGRIYGILGKPVDNPRKTINTLAETETARNLRRVICYTFQKKSASKL